MNVSDALRGVAEHLATEGVGKWPGPYTAGDTAVVLKRLPATPDRALAITVYDVDLDVELPNEGLMVQVVSRAPGLVDAVDDLADAVLAVMHGTHHATWGDLHVSRCVHISTAPLGADGNGREERSDNYRIITTRTPGGSS